MSVDLSKVVFAHVDLDQVSETEARSDYVNLILNSNVQINANSPSKEMFWDLSMGATAQLSFLRFYDPNNEPGIPQGLDAKSLRDRHLVYDSSSEGEPITKLFLPLSDPRMLENLSRHQQLVSLSLDGSWLKARNYLESLDMRSLPDSFNDLDELRELYFPKWGSSISFGGLTKPTKIETLQFQSSSAGFDRRIFPKLKHAILVLDEAPSDRLIAELTAIKSLEKLTLVRSPEINSPINTFNSFAKQARGLFPNVQIEEVEFGLGLATDDFKEHCQRVRQMSIEKYLK